MSTAQTKMASPRVSICIPTFNDAGMVGDAIRSARAQEYPELEIVVLDNHSTDGTSRAIENAVGGDPRVRTIRHGRNLGMAGNFNAAIAEARGESMMILCADDALRPGCITTMDAGLRSHPDCVLACCGRAIVDAEMRERDFISARRVAGIVDGKQLIVECFAAGNLIGEPSAVLFRRAAAIRGFRSEYSQVIDLEMWFHLLIQGDAHVSPAPLAAVRRHDGQTSAANVRNGRLLADKRAFFREFAPIWSREMNSFEKLHWDARMASTVARMRDAGVEENSSVAEVFHRRLFPAVQTAVDSAYALQRSLRSVQSRFRSNRR